MPDPTLDETLRLLSHPYRRQTVQVLRDTGADAVAFDALLDALVREAPTDRPRRDRIVLELHHMHLPMLADHGIIDYDPDTEFVRYRADRQVEAVMDVVGETPSVPL